MAITSFDIKSCDKIPNKSSCSTNCSKGGGNSCRLLKMNFATDGSLSVTPSKSSKTKKKQSPYLTGDRVQLLSRVTEKRLVQKKTTDFISSFPLAVNIYKANSDEFKSSKKVNKKVKKSVLTLPNVPAPVPQICTVSDMNDSEYCDQTDEDFKQKVIKKRIPIKSTKKARVREKDFEFYDRDAKYCSQLNINLDCSSTDMMKNFNGDGKGVSNKKKTTAASNKTQSGNNNLNDVWAVLRNINRFQFRPSPPMSEESMVPIKKKVQKRRNRKDTRVFETCRTEEFAYISSYEVDDKTQHSFSPSSSIDRITVIDKQNEFSKICQEFEKRLLNTHSFIKDSKNTKNRIKKNKIRNEKNNVRTLGHIGPKENKQLVPMKKKKNLNFKSPTDQPIKSYPTYISSANKDSLHSAGCFNTTDISDILSHKTPDESFFPTSSSFICSEHSGSSKAEFSNKIKEKSSMTKVSLEKICSPLKGIPKVLLSNEEETNINSIAPKRFDSQKRKPRLVTTMPSSCIMPKLTQTEIKRRLAHIRYPLVILGKDQVSSHIPVLDVDPPQFNGLDDHIWPFMVEWRENCTFNKGDDSTKDPNRNNSSSNKKCNYYISDSNSIKLRKPKIEEATNRHSGFKDKKQANNDSASKKKSELKRPTPCSEIADKLLQSTKKQKSIVHLKDKMLNFLYKKSSSRNVINENHQPDENNDTHYATENKVDADFDFVTTEVGMRSSREPIEPTRLPKKRTARSPLPAILTNKRTLHYSYPWAKAKWASDFIENVIKKIKSGVYYTQEHKEYVTRKYQADMKEVSVQAGSLCDSSDSTQTNDSVIKMVPEVTITAKQNNYLSIPGFNNTLPKLELKTLNKNQIAVKHCVTNVMLQFDITVPAKSNQSTTSITKSTPLIPIEVTESHTKIYKCKTTILNAMLPAELCSILPRMMRTIINSNLNSDLPAARSPDKTDSCLSTISELTRYESPDVVGSVVSLNTKPEIKHVVEGKFSNKIKCLKRTYTCKINFTSSNNYDLVIELLPKLSLKDLSQLEVAPLVTGLNIKKETPSEIHFDNSIEILPRVVTDMQNPTCKAMQVYTGRRKRLSTAFKPYDLLALIERIVTNHNLVINLNLTSYLEMFKLQYDGKHIEINISMKKGVEKNMIVTITDLKIDSLYNACPKINNGKNHANRNNHHTKRNTHMKCIEYMNTCEPIKPENTEINQVNSIKNKRKGFYKLYRKCKSTTNIPSPEKCVNTPLNKVYTLDDFFQILGSKKVLCSVFDGYAAKKILSSITEMKNWITEINPRQALLILLLTNKKDTPNLVRFRPLILQGIAVNRITRATELDMEIEVIERENLNKFSQYEGISYLPETVTNYDNLLEELYWIAKTTASDYQRPFDESSERLLKSLIEKRKKLNPSYLRVMARYVGLGLLKSPTKN